MALTSYMKIEGQSQGEMKGDCPQGGDKKDTIIVFAVDHEIEIPKDTHTGLPTGQRIHHPLTVTKHVDQASPKIYKACCTGEQCTVTLDHYRIGPVGVEEKYFTIKLEEVGFPISDTSRTYKAGPCATTAQGPYPKAESGQKGTLQEQGDAVCWALT